MVTYCMDGCGYPVSHGVPPTIPQHLGRQLRRYFGSGDLSIMGLVHIQGEGWDGSWIDRLVGWVVGVDFLD